MLTPGYKSKSAVSENCNLYHVQANEKCIQTKHYVIFIKTQSTKWDGLQQQMGHYG